jgi:Tfp pilus assembly protein PilF
LITLGEMLSDLEPNRAITLLRKAIDQSADPQPAALLVLGTALLTRGNIDDAMNEYHKAITTGKQQRKKDLVAAVHMKLAIMYEERGQMDLAIQEYEKAMVADRQGDEIRKGMPGRLGTRHTKSQNFDHLHSKG